MYVPSQHKPALEWTHTFANANVIELRGEILPGAARVRFEWNDKKPPLYWSILAIIFVLTFFLWLGFDFIVPHIGSRVPDSRHSSAVSIYGGTYYVQRWAALFRDRGGWIPGSFFIALLLIQFIKGAYVPRAR
jgi:hypothetical protein